MNKNKWQSTSPSYSLTVRLQIPNRPGMLGRIISAIGKTGGNTGAIDIVSASKSSLVRDITIHAANEEHAQSIVRAVKAISRKA